MLFRLCNKHYVTGLASEDTVQKYVTKVNLMAAGWEDI